MASICYGVAMSLDGYIAGRNGDTGWMIPDPEMDFTEVWAQFDTLLMGRRTYEAALARLGNSAFAAKRTVVVSRTLRPVEHPELTVLPDIGKDALRKLRSASSKGIWLMGGGELFRELLALGEVDRLEVSILPVLLSEGVPLLPPAEPAASLRLTGTRVYRATGTVRLTYEVCR